MVKREKPVVVVPVFHTLTAEEFDTQLEALFTKMESEAEESENAGGVFYRSLHFPDTEQEYDLE